jgi:hypothetical protein
MSGGRFAASASTLSSLAQETEGYDMTKHSVHFDSAAPLSVVLVRKPCQNAISRRLSRARTFVPSEWSRGARQESEAPRVRMAYGGLVQRPLAG